MLKRTVAHVGVVLLAASAVGTVAAISADAAPVEPRLCRAYSLLGTDGPDQIAPGFVQGRAPGSWTPTPGTGGATATGYIGFAGDDKLEGTEGADCIHGGAGADTLTGLGGDDVLLGGDGQDQLDGGPGSDQLAGGAGNDSLLGGEGDDFLWAGLGHDVLDGGSGNDTLFLHGAHAEARAGAGDDIVHAVNGIAEVVDCGEGADTADVDPVDLVHDCEAVKRVSARDVSVRPRYGPPTTEFDVVYGGAVKDYDEKFNEPFWSVAMSLARAPAAPECASPASVSVDAPTDKPIAFGITYLEFEKPSRQSQLCAGDYALQLHPPSERSACDLAQADPNSKPIVDLNGCQSLVLLPKADFSVVRPTMRQANDLASSSPSRLVRIQAVVEDGGIPLASTHLEPLDPLVPMERPVSGDGSYRAVAYGPAGERVMDFPLSANRPVASSPFGASIDHLARVDQTVELPRATVRVDLLRGDSVIATRTASPTIPTVEVSIPSAAHRSSSDRQLQLAWQITDPDMDADAQVTVQYQRSPGHSWIEVPKLPRRLPAKEGRMTVTAHLQTMSLEPGKKARFRVVVSDGFYSSAAESRPIRIKPRPVKTLRVISPRQYKPWPPKRKSNESVLDYIDNIYYKDSVVFSADAEDPNDGIQKPVTARKAFRWYYKGRLVGKGQTVVFKRLFRNLRGRQTAILEFRGLHGVRKRVKLRFAITTNKEYSDETEQILCCF